MPMPGRKPKPPDQRRNRMPPRHEWTEVPNVAFKGRPLPPRPLNLRIGQESCPLDQWPALTQQWWRTISSMPHCALWDEAEWQFAADTMILVAGFHLGDMRLSTEIRNREKIMGTTPDSRRDLRIRYVDADSGTESDPVDTASVTAMADYQRMVNDQTS